MASLGKYTFNPEEGQRVICETVERVCPSLDNALKVKWKDLKNR